MRLRALAIISAVVLGSACSGGGSEVSKAELVRALGPERIK